MDLTMANTGALDLSVGKSSSSSPSSSTNSSNDIEDRSSFEKYERKLEKAISHKNQADFHSDSTSLRHKTDIELIEECRKLENERNFLTAAHKRALMEASVKHLDMYQLQTLHYQHNQKMNEINRALLELRGRIKNSTHMAGESENDDTMRANSNMDFRINEMIIREQNCRPSISESIRQLSSPDSLRSPSTSQSPASSRCLNDFNLSPSHQDTDHPPSLPSNLILSTSLNPQFQGQQESGGQEQHLECQDKLPGIMIDMHRKKEGKSKKVNPLECQICFKVSDSKLEHIQHSKKHEEEYYCINCHRCTEDKIQFINHFGKVHAMKGIKRKFVAIDFKPKLNAQKQAKNHNCKKCDYSTVIQAAMWEHIKIHIPENKKLQCSECTFVTDLKHHYDFHMDNHFGVKKFKCEYEKDGKLCGYACVNKSMLQSHKKSHEDHSRFYCTCGKVGKFLTAFKLHFKQTKNSGNIHRIEKILDGEGKETYLLAIDLDGNRRLKKKSGKDDLYDTKEHDKKRNDENGSAGAHAFPSQGQVDKENGRNIVHDFSSGVSPLNSPPHQQMSSTSNPLISIPTEGSNIPSFSPEISTIQSSTSHDSTKSSSKPRQPRSKTSRNRKDALVSLTDINMNSMNVNKSGSILEPSLSPAEANRIPHPDFNRGEMANNFQILLPMNMNNIMNQHLGVIQNFSFSNGIMPNPQFPNPLLNLQSLQQQQYAHFLKLAAMMAKPNEQQQNMAQSQTQLPPNAASIHSRSTPSPNPRIQEVEDSDNNSHSESLPGSRRNKRKSLVPMKNVPNKLPLIKQENKTEDDSRETVTSDSGVGRSFRSQPVDFVGACTLCNNQYMTQDQFARHMVFHIDEQQPLTCSSCKRQALDGNDFKCHLSDFHKI